MRIQGKRCPTTNSILNEIKYLIGCLTVPAMLAANREAILARLREEGGVVDPEDVMEKIIAGNDPGALQIAQKALWRLYYTKLRES